MGSNARTVRGHIAKVPLKTRARQPAQLRTAIEQATRMRILDTALTLFVERGFEAVGLAEIARRSAVSPSLLHYYFSSKLDLWKAAVAQGFGSMCADLTAAISFAKDLSPESQIRVFVRSFIFFASSHLAAFRLAITEQSIDSPRLRWLESQYFNPIFGLFEPILQQAQRSGSLRRDIAIHSLYPILTGAILHHLSSGHVYTAITGRDPVGSALLEQHADLVSDALFRGLLI